jgi:hypothetical protein
MHRWNVGGGVSFSLAPIEGIILDSNTLHCPEAKLTLIMNAFKAADISYESSELPNGFSESLGIPAGTPLDWLILVGTDPALDY